MSWEKDMDFLVSQLEESTNQYEQLKKDYEELDNKYKELSSLKESELAQQKIVAKSSDNPAQATSITDELNDALEMYRQIIKSRTNYMIKLETEATTLKIKYENYVNELNTYKKQFLLKSKEYTKLLGVHELLKERALDLEIENKNLKSENIILTDKFNEMNEVVNTIGTPEQRMLAENVVNSFARPKKKLGRKDVYADWVIAYENGVVDPDEMEKAGICSKRTFFRNVKRYKEEHCNGEEE